MARHVVNCVRFMRAIGPLTGVLTYFNLHRSRNGIARVASPTGDGVVHVRRGSTDANVFDQIFVMRDYDVRRFRQWKRVIQTYNDMVARGPKPLILDFGANTGLSARYLSHLFPGASIVAVEPEAGNFSMLQDNVRLHPNIRPVRAAISDLSGQVSITDPKAGNWAFRVRQVSADDPDAVPAITVEQARAVAGDHQLFAVKVDIESAEKQLFASNTGWLDETAVLMIELHDWMLPWAGTSRTFFRALSGMDFDFVLAGETAMIFNWSVLLKDRS